MVFLSGGARRDVSRSSGLAPRRGEKEAEREEELRGKAEMYKFMERGGGKLDDGKNGCQC